MYNRNNNRNPNLHHTNHNPNVNRSRMGNMSDFDNNGQHRGQQTRLHIQSQSQSYRGEQQRGQRRGQREQRTRNMNNVFGNGQRQMQNVNTRNNELKTNGVIKSNSPRGTYDNFNLKQKVQPHSQSFNTRINPKTGMFVFFLLCSLSCCVNGCEVFF